MIRSLSITLSPNRRTWLIQWRDTEETYNIKSFHSFKDASDFVDQLLMAQPFESSIINLT